MQVAPEKALVADARERLLARRYLAALLGLDQLVQALSPGSVFHYPAGMLIDHLDLAVANKVVVIALEQVQCGQRLRHQFLAPHRARPDAAEPLAKIDDPLMAGFGQRNSAIGLEDDVIVADDQLARQVHRLRRHQRFIAGRHFR